MTAERSGTTPNTSRWSGPLILIGFGLVLGACGVVDNLTGGTTTEPTPTIGADVATTSLPPSAHEQTEGGESSTAKQDPEAGPTDVSELCASLPGLPYTLRQGLVDDLGPDQIDEALSICPDELATIEAIADVADRSVQLNVEGAHQEGAGAIGCDERGITFDYRNKFAFPIRMIVVGTIDVDGDVVGTTWAVTEPIDPEKVTAIEMEYEGFFLPGGGARCSILMQGFLELDDELTDTWDSALGLTEPLPAADGEPDLEMVVELIAAELDVISSGDWERAAGFEDVRSKNYIELTTRTEPGQPYESTLSLLCSVDRITDDLVAIVWSTGNERGGLAGASLGVFHRSAIDGRWRWVHTGMALDVDSSCGQIA